MQQLAENLIQAPGISSRNTLSYADVTDEEVEGVVHFLINRGIKHRAFDRFVAG
jgi:hypothetical protein